MRAALEWEPDPVQEADAFVRARFAECHGEQAEGGWGGGVGEVPAFLAVHWRRGDRAYREEMGAHY